MCLTCTFGSIRVSNTANKVIECSSFETKITEPIVECSAYLERGRPSLFDMTTMAYIMTIDPKTSQPIGFVRFGGMGDEEKRKIRDATPGKFD